MKDHSLIEDLGRGFRCRCPQCGEGRLFRSYLKSHDRCAVCGEEFHHHRADDFPAYIVVVIVGHIMVSFALGLEDIYHPPYWVHLATSFPLALLLTVGLLQPVKGAVIALQWRIGMHGFAKAKLSRLSKTTDPGA